MFVGCAHLLADKGETMCGRKQLLVGDMPADTHTTHNTHTHAFAHTHNARTHAHNARTHTNRGGMKLEYVLHHVVGPVDDEPAPAHGRIPFWRKRKSTESAAAYQILCSTLTHSHTYTQTHKHTHKHTYPHTRTGAKRARVRALPRVWAHRRRARAYARAHPLLQKGEKH